MNENAALWFVDRHLREGRAEKTAFREAWGENRELSYGDLSSGAGQVADALSRHGIRREERAAMFVLDQVEFPLIFWGALKAGVVPIALNTLLTTEVYANILADSRAAIAFVSAELLETVGPALANATDLRNVVVIGGDPGGRAISWREFLADAGIAECVTCKSDEVAFWLYSSGSTGAPKGVRHVHGSMRVTCDTFGQQVLGIEQDDLVFSAAKLFFAYGMGNGMTFPMSVGATAILFNGRPTPDSVSEILRSHNPTIFYGVPTLFAALLHKWETDGDKPQTPLRVCTSAGEALPAEIGKAWRSAWGVDIVDGVGSTEMLHIFLSNRPGEVEYGTSGVAVPGYDVRLVDDLGAPVSDGEIGELLVRGGSAAADYWNQRDKTRRTFEGEWTRTGDKYEMREDGRYIYCGRTDDLFKVSGIWVSPFEVEQALVEHPDILEAAVVADLDDAGLEKPRAFVVLKGANTPQVEELQEFIKSKIGKWKYPRWIDFVEDLPKTATGKIQRFKLRASE